MQVVVLDAGVVEEAVVVKVVLGVGRSMVWVHSVEICRWFRFREQLALVRYLVQISMVVVYATTE